MSEIVFDQREFTRDLPSHGLSSSGVAYVPPACRASQGCRVHVIFHGCNQHREKVGDVFIKETGYPAWADANRLVLLYPQVTTTTVNPQACWDWWGYTGRDYLTRNGPQIAAVRRMLPHRHGAVFLTGASAGVKGYAQSAPFAMGKFALRGLAQSMARELSPQGIHVAHIVVDGGIRSARRQEAADKPDSLLDPDAIAASYVHLLNQPRNAWSWELEVRPWVENF